MSSRASTVCRSNALSSKTLRDWFINWTISRGADAMAGSARLHTVMEFHNREPMSAAEAATVVDWGLAAAVASYQVATQSDSIGSRWSDRLPRQAAPHHTDNLRSATGRSLCVSTYWGRSAFFRTVLEWRRGACSSRAVVAFSRRVINAAPVDISGTFAFVDRKYSRATWPRHVNRAHHRLPVL